MIIVHHSNEQNNTTTHACNFIITFDKKIQKKFKRYRLNVKRLAIGHRADVIIRKKKKKNYKNRR